MQPGCSTADSSLIVAFRFANTDFAREMLRDATKGCTKSEKFPQGRNIEVYKPGDTRFATNFRMISRTLELAAAIKQVTFFFFIGFDF